MGKPAYSYNEYLQTTNWRYRRGSVLVKRGPRCEICRAVSGAPDIHHLHYGSLGDERPVDLQVVCRACHDREHFIRPKESFSSEATLRKYLKGVSVADLNRRFPQYWIDPKKKRHRPPVKINGIVRAVKPGDPLTFKIERAPKVMPDEFAVISTAGFKCEFCVKPISVGNFQVSKGKASCGCDLRADFLAK